MQYQVKSQLAEATITAKSAREQIEIIQEQVETMSIRAPQDGIITTIAGSGQAGYSGDGGLAVRASLNLMGAIWTQYTGGVAVDSGGNIYISDTNNNRVRRVTPHVRDLHRLGDLGSQC